MRIALGDPGGPQAAERGEEEGIGDAMAAKIRNALTLYRPLLAVENIELRLHRTVRTQTGRTTATAMRLTPRRPTPST